MGLFTIVKVADYQVKQGDTEVLSFVISGFDFTSHDVLFTGVCPTGRIEKGSFANQYIENEDIDVTEFTANAQTVTVNFADTDFKTMQGTMKYEIQISTTEYIYTIIEGNLIIKPEIIK
jgi:hypothetical protein